MPSFPRNAALILIDVQQGFDDPTRGRRNNLDAETNMASLLHAWRQTERPIIHIQHCSRNPPSVLHASASGNAIKEIVRPQGEEPVLQKQTARSLEPIWKSVSDELVSRHSLSPD